MYNGIFHNTLDSPEPEARRKRERERERESIGHIIRLNMVHESHETNLFHSGAMAGK